MNNPLRLSPGQKYKVIKAFTDFDKIQHPIGESWTFITTYFLPYEDGLTLFVTKDNIEKELSYRFRWTQEEQADIIDRFSEYVEEVK